MSKKITKQQQKIFNTILYTLQFITLICLGYMLMQISPYVLIPVLLGCLIMALI